MNEISINTYKSIDEINKEEWDSIVEENHIINSYEYQKAIEKSKINDLKYRYYMFYMGEKLIAHISLCIFTFNLDLMAGKIIKKICDNIRKIFPNFLVVKFIECGHPSCLGNTFSISDKKYLPDIIRLIDKEMIKLARQEKTSLIGIRDFYSNEIDDFNILLKLKYKVILNLSNTFLKIEEKSFDEYLDDLISKRRHEITHRLELFKNSGCTIEKIIDFAGLSDDIYKLWHNTFLNSKEYQREILNPAYFRFLSDYLKEKSFIFLCKKNDKPIGFTMFLDSGDTLVSTYCGLDYEYSKSSYVYFILFYKTIEEAINLNKKWLELGVTNYNPKIEIGAIPEPLYVYIKSTNIILNNIIAVLFKLISVSPNFNKRKIFNNRYFERHKIHDKINVKINNYLFKLNDISEKGISVEGNNLLKNNHIYNIEILIPDDFNIMMTVKIKSLIFYNNNYRIGMLIHKINKEYITHWDNFFQKYSK
jgi:predicted N-acyltransferase